MSESITAIFNEEAAKSQTYTNVIGEELFQSDYGSPLEGQEEILSTAFPTVRRLLHLPQRAKADPLTA